jgi:hypothetical protein
VGFRRDIRIHRFKEPRISNELRFAQRVADGFLLTIFKAVAKSEAPFNQMAINLSGHETNTLSRQAMHKRVRPVSK